MEKPLARLLTALQPRLHDGVYTYCTLPTDAVVPPRALASFRENEGLTVILALDEAKAAGLTPRFLAAWISLEVNSALDAVGLTAAVSAVLADAGIPCNVVAAFHHDHIFVPVAQARAAYEALNAITERSA